MKIDMTAEEFRSMNQNNEALNNRIIDLTVKLNNTQTTLTQAQRDLYNEQQKTTNQQYTLDNNKRTIDTLTKQIDDPTSGWRASNQTLKTQLDALSGKSAVPIAALKNFLAIALGNPADKKAAIEALKSLTLQSVKEATALWEEIMAAALQQRKP
jgi:septal ring factor EnvC (AmiA/AmiB activator)